MNPPFKQRQVVEQRLDDLKPRARNPRTHTKKQIGQIADSIKEFGFTNPVLVDGANNIIAGHGRLAAARLLGLEKVPSLRLDHLTEAQVRAYVIADNKLAELAGWDSELLALELQGLIELETDFDVTITGFEMPEVDLLMTDRRAPDEPDPADVVPETPDTPPVTRPGDLWVIGRHRLLCSDTRDPRSCAKLLNGARAQMVFTDWPRVPIGDLGKARHRNFPCASGAMSEAEFTGVFTNLVAHSIDGAIHFICCDWRHIGEVIAAGKQAYGELKDVCVWAKTNGAMGSLYRSQYDLVFVFKSGRTPHVNNVELGRHGRNRTNLWTYPGANAFGKSRDADLAHHPKVKPVALVADAILDCSTRGQIVLDAFAGNGTTLIAAERTRRIAHAIELDPAHCDTIVRRLKQSCGLNATHAATGLTFEEMLKQRDTDTPNDHTELTAQGDEEEIAS